MKRYLIKVKSYLSKPEEIIDSTDKGKEVSLEDNTEPTAFNLICQNLLVALTEDMTEDETIETIGYQAIELTEQVLNHLTFFSMKEIKEREEQ